MVRTVSLDGLGCKFIFKIDIPDFFCDCFIECNKKKRRLGMRRLDELINCFLEALTRSDQEVTEAYADESKKGNTTLVMMFGSASLATIEYEKNGVTIQWEDARRKVLGVTKLKESDKQKWIQEFEKLREIISPKSSSRS